MSKDLMMTQMVIIIIIKLEKGNKELIQIKHLHLISYFRNRRKVFGHSREGTS